LIEDRGVASRPKKEGGHSRPLETGGEKAGRENSPNKRIGNKKIGATTETKEGQR